MSRFVLKVAQLDLDIADPRLAGTGAAIVIVVLCFVKLATAYVF